MNEEKQQIEEMAITICRKRHACILKDDESCRKCDQHERCLYQDIAYALYQEGYRKQSEVVKAIADFMYDGEIEGLAISMGGVFLTKNEFIDKFAGAKMKGGAE